MKKEAKGKPEQMKQAGRQIPIGMFSSHRWSVDMKIPSPAVHDWASSCRAFAPLYARELNLDALFTAAYQKLAA